MGRKVNFGNNGHYFEGAAYLTSTATDAPDLTGTTNLSYMFHAASGFNQNIGAWNTANVTNMSYMFSYASGFNQNIGGWNTGNVTDMSHMFDARHSTSRSAAGTPPRSPTCPACSDARRSSTRSIGAWNTSNVTNMDVMFAEATTFNQNIGGWNTSNVTGMSGMFDRATSFNQNIGAWNTSNVTGMDVMFRVATGFNQNVGTWNTGNVTNMGGLFSGATAFNQNIGAWNTGNVTRMAYMFYGASSFNQNIGGWDVGKVTAMDTMFDGSGLSTASYDRVLVGWSGLPSVQPGVPLGAAGIQYSCAAKTARQSLVTGHGWVITDAGLGPCVSVTPDPVGFAATTVGQTTSGQTVTVSNPGGADLVLLDSAVSLTGTDAGQFAVTGGTCSGATVPPFGICTVTVRFSPSSTGGKTAGLRLDSNAASSPDTVALSGTGIAVPQPPTAVAGSPGDTKVTVSWAPPADDGGTPILDYTATSSPRGAICTTTGTSCVVTGLVNGTAYTLTVTARNSVGTSAPSTPSAPVIPKAATPGKVTGFKAVINKGKVKITWKPVPSATSYRVRISKPGGTKYKAWKTTARRVFKAKVVKGKKYRFQVAAVGAGGRGPVTTVRFKGK